MTPNTEDLNRTVFISDNLPFLKALDTESVDLVVIDPPFGKNQTFTGRLRPPLTDAELEHEYDLLISWGIQNESDAYEAGLEFPDQSGITASFKEIWDFRYQVTEADWDMLEAVCPPARHLIEATRYTHSDSTAGYIAFMTMRMIEIRRILKSTGSVYLHCDHEANAYLRQMMDAVFGQQNFRNEIVWRRTSGRSDGEQYGRVHDTILFYSKSDAPVWNNAYGALDNGYVRKAYRMRDDIFGRFRSGDLTGANISEGESGQAWKGIDPTNSGRHWSAPRTGAYAAWIDENVILGYQSIPGVHARLDALDAAGLILWPEKQGGIPALKRYLAASLGTKVNDIWTDINPLGSSATERTGYPTQKPQALARRIIESSSNPGDLVLDCFAGCAYVPVAAELTGRHWIACDMSLRAWTVVRRQFHKHPKLGILTEGEYSEIAPDRPGEGVKLELGDKRIIKVRGPHDLPVRRTNDEQQEPSIRILKPIQFRQKPVETGIQIWEAFVDEWGPACWYCGSEMDEDRRLLHLDHVEPNSRDGSNDDCWNRALACAPCNSDKSDQMTVEQAIDKALAEGRIARNRLRDEQRRKFAERRQWAKERWERIKINILPL